MELVERYAHTEISGIRELSETVLELRKELDIKGCDKERIWGLISLIEDEIDLAITELITNIISLSIR